MLSGAFLGSLAVAVAAASLGPDEVVRETTDRFLAAMDAAGGRVEKDPQYLNSLVDEIVMPVVDLEVSARLVLGKHWTAASEAQRVQFRDDLRMLLIRTYAKSLIQARERRIVYLPLRALPGDRYATVDTRVLSRPGQEELTLSYCMRLAKQQWSLYDVKIDGVSLVRSLRTSFEKEIEQVGLDAFFENLSRRNREKETLQ